MPTARKEAEVAELQELVSNATISISTQYRGMSVAEMTALRRKLRESGVEVRVVKNTLFKLAAERAGLPKIAELAVGPTAIIFGTGDVTKSAKSVQEYIRTARSSLTVQSAYMDGEIMPAAALGDIASLPSKEQLLVNFMSGLRSPIATFAGLMSGTIQKFAGLIDSRAKQLEGNAA